MAAIVLSASSAVLVEASSAALPQEALPTEWKPWNGHHYRLEANGHLSCYSEDGSNSTCSINAPDPAKARPLRCDDPRWGSGSHRLTGYQVVDHWCNNAYATLFAPWRDYTPLGHDLELATNPRGDVMCRSADGTTCLPARRRHERNAPSQPDARPLVCGEVMRAQAGETGYDTTGHWCQSNEIVQESGDDDVWSFSETQVDPRWRLDRYRSGSTFKRLPADAQYAWLVTTKAPREGTWTYGNAGTVFHPNKDRAWKMRGTISHAGKAGNIRLTTPLVSSEDLPSDGFRSYDTLSYAVRAEADGKFTYRQSLNQPLDPFDATPGVTLKRKRLQEDSPKAGVTVATTFHHPGLSPDQLWTRTLLVKKRSLPNR